MGEPYMVWKIRDRRVGMKLLLVVAAVLWKGGADVTVTGGRFFFNERELPQLPKGDTK